jgi:hypothetical protein
MLLNFSKLYHKSDLINHNSHLFNVPGVYIWGFIYENKADQIGDPVDFSNVGNPMANPVDHVFIPYYVGKHKRSVLNRLNEHRNFTNGNAQKYTRFTLEFMKYFFKDPAFRLNTNTNNPANFINLIQNYGFVHTIEYFNNRDVLSEIYGNAINIVEVGKNDFPIQLQTYKNGHPLFDTLDFLGNTFDNFFFTYAEINDEDKLTRCESVTALLLKGKTVSKIEDSSGAINAIQNNLIHIVHNNFQHLKFPIFKDVVDFWEDPNMGQNINNIDFPGYLKAKAI